MKHPPEKTTFYPTTSSSPRGFTLIELLTVIAIIGILAAILIPVVGTVRATARTAACQSNMRQVAFAATNFALENRDRLPPLYTTRNHFSQIDANRTLTEGAGVFAWPDILMSYVDGAEDVFSCPELSENAVPGDGGISSRRQPMGIGMNFNYIGGTLVSPGNFTRLDDIREPTRVMMFADAGGGPHSDGDFSDRRDTPGRGATFFRGNTEQGVNAMPRHGGRINAAFVDGHVRRLDPNNVNWGPRDPQGDYGAWVDPR